MAFSHEFDPSNGFVALPSDIMDIEMSPGAFRLLVELCRMANRTGECWPSLGQLSGRIGRSKAAISGYITELRGLNLLQTSTQKMANGYNYRLKYCITFWQNWRRRLSEKQAQSGNQKSEHSVQPVERRVNSKNHTHKNHSLASKPKSDPNTLKLVSVFSQWSNLAKSAPFPSFNEPVKDTLLSETLDLLTEHQTVPIGLQEIRQSMKRLWSGLGVITEDELFDSQVARLNKDGASKAKLLALDKTIREQWQPHWRKLPSSDQFEDLLKKSQAHNREEGMVRMLAQYVQRWKISQNKLQRSDASLSLALDLVA